MTSAKKPQTKCALCGDYADYESPFVFYDVNPQTFRRAWMHSDCFSAAYDDLASMPASNVNFLNRQDEYEQKALS